MKVVRFHAYGDACVLRHENAPLPEPGEGDVLIKVHAAGVNPADVQFRRGDYQAFVPLALPFILGWDVAGSVVAGAGDFAAGDAAFAMADMNRNGAYAEYVAVRAANVAHAPTRIPLEHAAGVPLAALTAWSALFDIANLQSGQTVLIHAGAGGVGQFAIQLARRAGARVIATASAANHEMLRRLGADVLVDYRTADFAEGLRDVDVVLDTIGGQTRLKSWPVLRSGGILVAIAMPPPDAAVAQEHGVRAAMVTVLPSGDRLAEIARLIDVGELEVMIDSEFPLAQAAYAHRRIEQGHTRGKIILRVS
ncbi:MAG TPA: NADP-dependent oxidoreductase [Steroidobacteraceae bacterium]|nr:NADP-dependent oxidoreductase [Steroidobacteraceae bacterium]